MNPRVPLPPSKVPYTPQASKYVFHGWTNHLISKMRKPKMSRWPLLYLPQYLKECLTQRMCSIILEKWNRIEWNGKEWKSFSAIPQAKSFHNMMDSSLVSSSLARAGSQPEENEDDKSEKKNHGKPKALWGEGWGKWCLQTNGYKQDLSVSNLDLIR